MLVRPLSTVQRGTRFLTVWIPTVYFMPHRGLYSKRIVLSASRVANKNKTKTLRIHYRTEICGSFRGEVRGDRACRDRSCNRACRDRSRNYRNLNKLSTTIVNYRTFSKLWMTRVSYRTVAMLPTTRGSYQQLE